MGRKMGLGRGLSAILPDVEDVVEAVESAESRLSAPADAVVELPLGDIDPNRSQPRKHFDDEALSALSDSIRHSGVISPILVARDGARYTIIAGERRWRAACMAGLATIPAIIREWDEIRRQEAALIENIQRENLNPIEEAQGVYVLMNECAATQESIAERLGRSRSAVANSLRLLSLPKAIQQAVAQGVISSGHGRVLAGVADKAVQAQLFEQTVKHGWSVRQLEEAARRTPEKKEKRRQEPLPAEYDELADRLRSATGLKVSLQGTQSKGRIVLEYTSQEELQRLWDWMEP